MSAADRRKYRRPHIADDGMDYDDRDAEITRLRAELVECKQQLSRYQRMVNEASPHMVCENVHHEKADQHGLDEDCPVVARWHALAAKGE